MRKHLPSIAHNFAQLFFCHDEISKDKTKPLAAASLSLSLTMLSRSEMCFFELRITSFAGLDISIQVWGTLKAFCSILGADSDIDISQTTQSPNLTVASRGLLI